MLFKITVKNRGNSSPSGLEKGMSIEYVTNNPNFSNVTSEWESIKSAFAAKYNVVWRYTGIGALSKNFFDVERLS
ncbi:hypothetical protein SDC9_105217 [bioreactor metagenome]|uniref:Uncharacterized protein n=1 Tax=bioreactor metagenome TaxID=1076179 RepID=A0A645B021_9ZZZZ|nr:DUF6140 family protein [Paludibacter sp.]